MKRSLLLISIITFLFTLSIDAVAQSTRMVSNGRSIITNAAPVITPPNISYQTPQTYTVNTAITPLGPKNTGGAVPPNTYGLVTTFAGGRAPVTFDGTGTNAGFNLPSGIAVDAAGTVYVSDFGSGAIRKITPATVVTTINNVGTPAGLTLDTQGNLFVTDFQGNYVYEITGGGVNSIYAGNGTAGAINGSASTSSFNNPGGIVADASGNVFVADQQNNTIREITTAGIVETFAGSGSAGATNGTNANASFNNPDGLAFDGQGNLYVADTKNNLIRKITPAGVVTTFAGSGAAGNSDGTGISASFNYPTGVVFDALGNLYVADYKNNLVRKITPAGIVTTLAGNGSTGQTNAIGKLASFNGPIGLATNASDYLYVTDEINYVVRKIALTGYTIDKPLPAGLLFDPTTGIISGTPIAASPSTSYTITAYNLGGSISTVVNITVTSTTPAAPNISYQTPQTYDINTTITPLSPKNTGGAVPADAYGQATVIAGSGSTGSTNGAAAIASFNQPHAVAVDKAGNIYIADANNHLIRKITPSGVVSTFAGSGTAGFTDGTGTAASFNFPTGLAVDAAGNVYVADQRNDAIRKITPAGVVTTFAGNGTAGTSDGTGAAARFNYPHGIAIDAAGNLYVADQSNRSVRKISPAGVVTTVATGFNQPEDVTVDPAGNIYVTDLGNDVIKKITPGGVISTFAGTGTIGSNNGNVATASFYGLYGISADAYGNIYIADTYNNLIRKIDPSGNVSTLGIVDAYGLTVDGNGQLFVGDIGTNQIKQVATFGYTIDKPLPAGLNFDPTTGIISGTPTVLSPATDYTVTAYNAGGNSRTIVNIAVTSVATITPSAATGTISACVGSASASPDIQQFTVSGNSLTDVITATAPPGFEISFGASGTYGSSVSLSEAVGTTNNTILYVRSAAADPAGNISGNVVLSSPGAANQNVAVTGVVNALPTVNPVTNQTVTSGAPTTAINFTGTANTYTWTNNTPGIGLPASGTGDIAAFTTTNTGTTPIKATITVTPTSVPYAYILNDASNNISVIDTRTNMITATIPVGKAPFAVAASPNGNTIYVANQVSNTISVISAANNAVIATIPVGKDPINEVLSPDGSLLYVANNLDPSISVINTATNKVVFTITNGMHPTPTGIAISPDGTKLYVTDRNDGIVTVINTTSNTVTTSFYVTTQFANADIVSKDGSKLYVLNEYGGYVYVISTTTYKILNTIPVDSQPETFAITPDGNYLYVANFLTGSVSVINTATEMVTATIPVNHEYPFGVSITPDGSTVYVSNNSTSDVSVIDTKTNQIIATIPVGPAPAEYGNFISNGTGCPGASITFTITVNPAVPTITTTTPTGNISACIGSASESPNIGQFTVTGSNLTGDITTTAPVGFELSTSSNGPYYPFIINADIGGSVLPTLMYIRAAVSVSTGNISGNIVLTSPGATTQNVAVTGVINALPTVNQVASQTVTGGSPTTAINFTGTGNAFTWTNDTPGIGLPASGTGNIAPFTAVNTGSSPVTATVVVTPTSATGCSGASATFTFTIDPAPPETISFKPPPIKTYGDPDFSPAATSSNSNVPITYSSDNTGVASIVNGQIHITGAGTTNITASQAGNDSYGAATPVTQQLIVNKAPLTLTADDKTKTLGQPNPVLTFSHTPFAYNEDVSVLTTQPVLNTLATTNSAVGQYVISIGDATSPNYDITQLPGTLTINPAPASIVIPNAFTPNGDGVNDVWNIQSLIDFPQCLVSVYSRNGSLVFQSRGYGKPWDGTYNGSPVPTGTYYYIINPQDGLQLLSGYVVVLR